MFQFPGFPTPDYFIHRVLHDSSSCGFPHSDIRGSTLICSSPRLFAACHVLLRLLMPRHPPCALLCLNFSRYDFSYLRFSLELLCNHFYSYLFSLHGKIVFFYPNYLERPDFFINHFFFPNYLCFFKSVRVLPASTANAPSAELLHFHFFIRFSMSSSRPFGPQPLTGF